MRYRLIILWEERITKKYKTKKSRFFVLICVFSIMLVLGMVAGCSVQVPDSPETQTDNVFSDEEKAGKDAPGEESVDDSDAPVDLSQTQKPEKAEPGDTRTSEEDMSADAREIKDVAEKFAAAYFGGDMDTVQSCLTTPYEWDIEVYAGTEIISDFTLKGLKDTGEEAGSRVISLEYKCNEQEDSFQYLTLEFIRQEDSWKIQFYGIE